MENKEKITYKITSITIYELDKDGNPINEATFPASSIFLSEELSAFGERDDKTGDTVVSYLSQKGELTIPCLPEGPEEVSPYEGYDYLWTTSDGEDMNMYWQERVALKYNKRRLSLPPVNIDKI